MTITTTAPVVSTNGITAPTLDEIIDFLQSQYRNIFGQDIYLEPDSQDGQWLAIIAAAINDANSTAIEVYNSFSPATARNEGLSTVVKINGLQRQVATTSTVDLVLTGIPGTTIDDGVAIDDDQNRWVLPEQAVIGSNGSVTVAATAKDAGPIVAQPGTVEQIGTPTLGWQSVTNPSAAAIGRAVELDGRLRQRQTVSTELPSKTILAGIIAGVASLDGVTRYRGYENSTGVQDQNGIPANSIGIVVEGGDPQAIAQAVAYKKTLGTPTVGATMVEVTDQAGQTTSIRFDRPTYQAITVQVNIEAMAGYLSNTGDAIKQAVADYINSIGIGRSVARTRLFVPANLSNDTATDTFEVNNVQLASGSGTIAETDIDVGYNGIATCDPEDVSIVIDQ